MGAEQNLERDEKTASLWNNHTTPEGQRGVEQNDAENGSVNSCHETDAQAGSKRRDVGHATQCRAVGIHSLKAKVPHKCRGSWTRAPGIGIRQRLRHMDAVPCAGVGGKIDAPSRHKVFPHVAQNVRYLHGKPQALGGFQCGRSHTGAKDSRHQKPHHARHTKAVQTKLRGIRRLREMLVHGLAGNELLEVRPLESKGTRAGSRFEQKGPSPHQ
jgi:hypothetical protein